MHPNKAYDEVIDFIAFSRLLNALATNGAKRPS